MNSGGSRQNLRTKTSDNSGYLFASHIPTRRFPSISRNACGTSSNRRLCEIGQKRARFLNSKALTKIKHMKNFNGVIIEESLENKDVLQKVKILKTDVESVTEKHKTPWIKQWTLHTVEILENQPDIIAKELSESLDSEHSWYADFKNDTHHYIIFRNKVFFIDRRSKEQYDEAKNYGISLGIPEYQVDFHPDIKEWER